MAVIVHLKENKLISVILSLITVISIIIFNKNNFNPDYQIYLSAFGGDDTRFEPLYQYASNIAYSIGVEYEFFYIAILLINSIFFIYICYTLPTVFIFLIIPTIIIFGFSVFGVQIRIGISYLIVLLGLLQEGKKKQIILFFLAIGVHYFSLVFIALYFFSIIISNKKLKYYLILLIELLMILISPLIAIILDNIASIIGYESYVGSEFFQSKSFYSIAYSFLTANTILFFTRNKLALLINYYILLMLVFFATSSLAIISGRLQIFIFFVEAILCSYLINDHFLTRKKFIIIVFLIYSKLIFLL
ncbi:EpsG family protein [Polynucleobacter sphagniphilus]|uniref:EpsG family protein n=1 Tax=Polynucleobacter sphagniphilus TaxID=1743169 RepID=UPI002406D354|nr:EpsG family protein [Polynucleobacter sphagniphilus]MDF9787846.1 hypothetical protein [Polynucleobacter sphagniphilus]